MYIYSMKDLSRFGVEPLTGEACAYGVRVLCDLNADGVELIVNYLGLTNDSGLAPPWNSTVNGKPAVASFMLESDAWESLAVYAMLRAGCKYIIQTPDRRLHGLDKELYNKYCKDFPDLIVKKWINRPGTNSIGDRNVHAFSGRTV